MNCLTSKPAPLALALALALSHLTASAQALPADPVPIRIAAQPLAQALNDWARQTGVQLVVQQSLVAGKTAPAVSGRLAPRQALDQLLAGSGLSASVEGNAVVIRTLVPGASNASLPAVTVQAEGEQSATSRVQGYVARRSATGTKTDTPIIETPQSISVITADRIEAMGAANLKDALGYTPGVSTTTYGADSRYDWISLRGFDAYSPGFYLDGMQMRNNAGYAVWRMESYGAERIEVLRGPSSVLYGQTGPGGMVNVVSKRPTEEPLREVQVQAGNRSLKRVAADFSGPLDAQGQWLYRLTAMSQDSQTQVDRVGDRRQFLAPSLTWRPSGDTSLTVLAHYASIRAGNAYGFLPVTGTLLSTPYGRIPSSTFVGEPGFDRYNQDQWDLGYLFEHRFDDTWTVRQNARYGRIKTDYRQIYANGFVTNDPDNVFDPSNFHTINRSLFASSPERGKTFTLDNQVQAKLRSGDWQHTVLLGLDYQRSVFDQVMYFGEAPQLEVFAPVYGQPFSMPAPNTDSRVRLSQTGIYLQDQIKWNERWVATLGGRYDRARVDTDNHLDQSTTRQSDHKFTGRAGLVYLAPGGLAPYVSYSESFSPSTTIDPDTRQPFKPETGKQYEVGLRYQPVGTRDSYSAAVFDLRRQNIVTFDRDFVPRQTGEARVRGLELEAAFEPMPRFNVVLAYSWTPSAKVVSDSNPDRIGKQLVGTPRNQVSAWADYRFGNGVKAGLGVRFMGSTHGANGTAPAKIPSYTVFDAMLGYDFEHWALALNARNLTDRIYLGRNCDAYSCGYGERRSLVATATYRW